jgi:hypothetical protein
VTFSLSAETVNFLTTGCAEGAVELLLAEGIDNVLRHAATGELKCLSAVWVEGDATELILKMPDVDGSPIKGTCLF